MCVFHSYLSGFLPTFDAYKQKCTFHVNMFAQYESCNRLCGPISMQGCTGEIFIVRLKLLLSIVFGEGEEYSLLAVLYASKNQIYICKCLKDFKICFYICLSDLSGVDYPSSIIPEYKGKKCLN